MQIKFTKDLLVGSARERCEAGRPPFGPTPNEVRAFLSLCGGKSDDITVQLDDPKGTLTVRDVENDILDNVIAPRVAPYTGMGAFMAARLHDELEALAKERGHKEFRVLGIKCFDNNGVLHVETMVRDCRKHTMSNSRTLWNVVSGNVAVNVSDLLVNDCIVYGGPDLPLTRWFRGGYPKGDYCTIKEIEGHGTEAD